MSRPRRTQISGKIWFGTIRSQDVCVKPGSGGVDPNTGQSYKHRRDWVELSCLS